MRRCWVPASALICSTLCVLPKAIDSAFAGGMGISSAADTLIDPASQAVTNKPFHLYEVPLARSPLANRDLEFLWSDRYKQLLKPLATADENDLDRLGRTLCEIHQNPFGFEHSEIQLAYEYLNVRVTDPAAFRDSLYRTNPDSTGFRIYALSDPADENNHADVYIFHADDDPFRGGIYPSLFEVFAEDSLTPHAITYPNNSLALLGPDANQVGDTGPLRWTRPDTSLNQTFNHEFAHCINRDIRPDFGTGPAHYLHMLASAAEAIGGIHKGRPTHDVPYTWNLIRRDPGGNYQAWQSFTAYIAYNFRGVNLSGGTGRYDDLLWRWARQHERTLTSLAPRLSLEECAECATKTYFTGLLAMERFHLLVHNWRVAQFVNKPSLAEGQYAFPAQFNFDPIRDQLNWQSVDGSAGNDTVNIPLELTVNAGHITREISKAGHATPMPNAHVLALERFGADYWVIRSDPSLWSANRDLVIRAVPEGACRSRLMVSAIVYTEQNLAGGQPDAL
jgi:hypothetical protein